MSRIYLSSPTMGGEEQKYISEAFRDNWIAPLGPNVDNFEKELAAYVGIEHAAALSSGTAAIHLALKACGVGSQDIVLCSDLTFAASCNPIIYQNAIPVFIDSEPDSWNMSPVALEKALNKYHQAKAVVLVHLYGTPAKIDEILFLCAKHNVALIEDAAESLGATYQGKQTGTFGRFGIYSFNGNKIITTSGGGMLVSDEEAAIEKARFWATQSRDPAPYYQHSELGYNYRMSNIVAGIGRGQLEILKQRIQQKTVIYETYKTALGDIDALQMNPCPAGGEPNHWLSCATIDAGSSVKPMDIVNALAAEDIESRPIWKPMHLQPYFAGYDFISVESEITGVDSSISADIFERGVCLPSDVKMTEEDMTRVIKIVRKAFA